MNITICSTSITPSGTNAQQSSATASFPWHHTTSSYRQGNNAVADDCCAGVHLGPTIRHSSL